MHDAMPSSVCQSDVVDVARADALAATLGLGVTFKAGDALPPFFHQIYFWDARDSLDLGRDGHPRVGGLIPNMGLPRRMWAGGRLTFQAPFKVGIAARKVSRCSSATHKTGRSGPLALVTVRHDIYQNETLCLTEWQDLVYRADPTPGSPKPTPPVAPDTAQSTDSVEFNTTTLFRYSALTFNGHRIHYDLDYAQSVEGYDGLVVHGPLLAQMLMLKAQKELGPLQSFAFRATAPLMHFERARLCRRRQQLWVVGPDGRQCMTADAAPASK